MFHVEAHRLEIRIEHAGFGGEQQPTRLALQSSGKTGELRIGSSVRTLPVEPDLVLGQVDLADG